MLDLKRNPKNLAISVALAMGTAVMLPSAQAQTDDEETAAPSVKSDIEEVIVLGRLKTGAASIVDERFNEPFAADILGAEQISRIGDSDVAASLRRTSGVTLVGGKFVYIRGLGERYSNVRLNGAAIPSPELSRNVIPLDLMPTSIVDSIKIQKAYSADLPATFGGGNINIRTKGSPTDLSFNIGLGTGIDSNHGGHDSLISMNDNASAQLPGQIRSAISRFRGNISQQAIAEELDTDGGAIAVAARNEARALNRDLILSLNRDVAIEEQSGDLDLDADISAGNIWDVTDRLSFGLIASFNHEDTQRNRNEIFRSVGSPDVTFGDITRTLEERKQTTSFNFGFNLDDDHRLEFNNYFIFNSLNDASILFGQDQENAISDGQSELEYFAGYEERKLQINQVVGDHAFDLSLAWLESLADIKVNWFYSESTAETSIPNEFTSRGLRRFNPATGETLETFLNPNTDAARFSFLELEDEVESQGFTVTVPFEFGSTELNFIGGYNEDQKIREYFGYTMTVSATGIAQENLRGTPAEVLTDENILANDFELFADRGFGQESYLGAQKTLAGFGAIDMLFADTIRFNIGARWEEYQQGLLPVDLLDFDGLLIQQQIESLSDPDQTFASESDDVHPSMALTYMRPGFMNSEDFQLRFGYAQTVVRPDLRELAPIPYIDPELNQRVIGNPALNFTELDHFDIRGEWIFDDGDNLTVSLFYKDIVDPIESVRNPGSDDDIVLTFYNGEEAELYGIEFEGLKSLPYNLFVSGNITLSESEVVAPINEFVDLTNREHQMTGHSEYVGNIQLGYDSDDNLHSVSLAYNFFSERLWFSAPASTQHDDAFEQPFHSVDLIYAYYPNDQIQVKAAARNLLSEDREFEQTNSGGQSVIIVEQEVGTQFSLDFSYSFF